MSSSKIDASRVGCPPIEFRTTQAEAGHRLDLFLRQQMGGVSRGSISRLIARGLVLVEGRRAKKGDRLQAGQQIVVAVASWDERPFAEPELELRVVAVYPYMVAFNKPAGMSSHPLLPGEQGTAANAIAALFPECVEASARAREAGLVNRLDWGTSGLLLAARDRSAHNELRGLFSAGQVRKSYLALVAGALKEARSISGRIAPRPGDRRRVRVLPEDASDGQPALSEVRPLEQRGACTLVRVRCRSGRRHQVRIHLAHIGHPLLGDSLYGGPTSDAIQMPFLHAHTLQVAGEKLTAGLPARRRAALLALGFNDKALTPT